MTRRALVAALCTWAVSAVSWAQGEANVPPRLARARTNVQPRVQAMFAAAKVAYPPAEVFLRAIKDEDVLELWASSKTGQPMTRVKSYRVCARSGVAGPKREQGDGQVPEGFYFVDRFNAWSQFHLSLGIDYPNASDRLRKTADSAGGDIFIHGGCATIGCLPIEDGPVEELFVVASDARVRKIPVHLFPFRLTGDRLRTLEAEHPHRSFWVELSAGYQAFEATGRPPPIRIHPRSGAYLFQPLGAVAAGTGQSAPARLLEP